MFLAVGYLLPPLKATRLQHLQDIFAGRKRALRQKDVPARQLPHWPELAVKVVYPQVINLLPQLQDYLPDPTGTQDHLRYPDRDFFYRVLYALYPDTVEDLVR